MRPTEQLGAAVVAYASLGYRVLPLHHPIPALQLGLNDATSDPARLDRWWRG